MKEPTFSTDTVMKLLTGLATLIIFAYTLSSNSNAYTDKKATEQDEKIDLKLATVNKSIQGLEKNIDRIENVQRSIENVQSKIFKPELVKK